jgi:hypothetical protein
VPRSSKTNHAIIKKLAGSTNPDTGRTYSDKELADRGGCSVSYARLIRRGAIRLRSDGGSSLSREQPHVLQGRSIRAIPPFDHPQIMAGHTMFPSTVYPVGGDAILKPGDYSAKVGKQVTKGHWKGFRVYTLTLEERATCPVSCKHWRSCYGNGSQRAKRYRHGPELERALQSEIAMLADRHPGGFVVRLHILGDFYSVEYVELWRRLLERHPALHVFGFSARGDTENDSIAAALDGLIHDYWLDRCLTEAEQRFCIRISNGDHNWNATVSIEHPFGNPPDAIICPQQLGKTQACSTCGLCWTAQRRISFIQH